MLDRSSLYIGDISIDWEKIPSDSYLRDIRSIASIDMLSLNKPVTFFVGENGTGKSTLLEAIAVAFGFNPEGGTKNYSFSTYDSHSILSEAIRISKGYKRSDWGFFLRAESFYNVATAEEEYSKISGVPLHLHERSHGESFLAMLKKQFRSRGVYLLDEPEAALSPQRQLTLLAEIMNCVDNDCQFIISTHSPILLGLTDSEIFSFDDDTLHTVSYEETSAYQITRLFLDHRKKMLDELR